MSSPRIPNPNSYENSKPNSKFNWMRETWNSPASANHNHNNYWIRQTSNSAASADHNNIQQQWITEYGRLQIPRLQFQPNTGDLKFPGFGYLNRWWLIGGSYSLSFHFFSKPDLPKTSSPRIPNPNSYENSKPNSKFNWMRETQNSSATANHNHK